MSLILRQRSGLIGPAPTIGALNPRHPWAAHAVVAVVFDGADGAQEINRGTLGRKLTNTGTLTHRATTFGRALVLSGGNSRDVPHSALLNLSTMPRGFTVAAAADVGSVGSIFSKRWVSPSFFSPYGLNVGSGTAQGGFFIRAGGAFFNALYTSPPVPLNTGVHVYGGVFNGKTVVGYMDGIAVATTAVTNAVASTDDTTGDLQIGQDNWGSVVGNGPIRFFVLLRNYAASPAEMREFARNPMALFSPEPPLFGSFAVAGSGVRPMVFACT